MLLLLLLLLRLAVVVIVLLLLLVKLLLRLLVGGVRALATVRAIGQTIATERRWPLPREVRGGQIERVLLLVLLLFRLHIKGRRRLRGEGSILAGAQRGCASSVGSMEMCAGRGVQRHGRRQLEWSRRGGERGSTKGRREIRDMGAQKEKARRTWTLRALR